MVLSAQKLLFLLKQDVITLQVRRSTIKKVVERNFIRFFSNVSKRQYNQKPVFIPRVKFVFVGMSCLKIND